MKGFAALMMTLLVCGALALAQVCPPGYYNPQPVVVPIGSTVYPMTSTTMIPGMATMPGVVYPIGTPYAMSTMSTAYPTGLTSQDTSLLLNEIAALRNEVRSLSAQVQSQQIISQGQMLTARLNALMSQEMLFRQSIAANPNMPNAQMTALQLNAEAEALNRDIAAYNTQLSMIPASQRPYLAAQLNAFDMAYWQPTIQRFQTYQATLPAASVTYQPAFAANPWLQPWFTSYQTALTPLAGTQQVYASARWWNQPMVLGSTETFYGQGYYGMLPNGTVVFIPASTASGIGTTIAMVPMGTTITTVPMGTTTTVPAGTTTTPGAVVGGGTTTGGTTY